MINCTSGRAPLGPVEVGLNACEVVVTLRGLELAPTVLLHDPASLPGLSGCVVHVPLVAIRVQQHRVLAGVELARRRVRLGGRCADRKGERRKGCQLESFDHLSLTPIIRNCGELVFGQFDEGAEFDD